MAEQAFTTHHGMRDILPGEVEKWQTLEKLIREEAERYHFRELRTPIMEQTELIVRGVGQLTDIVSKEIFSFSRGEDNYVLRPECTAPVARAYSQHHMDQWGGTQKLYYIGPMFRAERPQKGRLRQFHQFGVEIMGSDEAVADVETISFMMRIFERIGITNTTLRLNSIGDPVSREAYKSALIDYFSPVSDQLSELSRKRLQKNPLRILDSKEEEDQPLIKNAPLISDYLNEESTIHFERVKRYLTAREINFELDPLLVRGLDYYTRTAFELVSPDLGSHDALAGGGRYDLLVEEVGGPPTPAVGFAAGIERLLIACDELGIDLSSPEPPDLYLVTLGEQAVSWAVEKLPMIRNRGIAATMDYNGRSMKAQMKDANRTGARYALIAGENELESGQFTFRNMEKSHEESLSLDQILTRISR